jgi:phosphoadenosine phosphosulfate reductase
MTDSKTWSKEELKKVNDSLEGKDPREVIRWVVDNFATKDFALACSFGELVLLDMLVKTKKDARVFYLDTGLLFKETLELKDKVEKMYGITVERHAPEMSLEDMAKACGPELWKTDPDKCCTIRKVEPLRKVLSGLKAWITGIRRDQAPTRTDIPIVGWDEKYGLVKINPLACWTRKQVWDYIVEKKVPYNKLLDRGYTSIGCEPCTVPVGEGEDQRSGRWAGRDKTECGLHE